MDEVLGRIARAVDATAKIVEGISNDQWGLATPCQGWDVRTVLNHTVGGMSIFAAELTGTDAGAEHEADWLGDDPKSAYAAAAERDLVAWRRPGALEQTVQISLGPLPGPLAAVVHFTELLVHGLDIALTTDQQDRIDEQLCAELLETMHAMGGIDGFRLPDIFGPEAPVPDDASAARRLLGYLGRHV